MQEWRDAIFLRYGLDPLDPPHYCDGCNANFSTCHNINCKWGGLVTACHNKLCDRVADLFSKAFTPSNVRNDPLVFSGCSMKRQKEKPARTKGTTVPNNAPPLEATEQKSDLMIRDLWQNGTDSIHDMRVVNTYAKSHL